ncbi:MULTISPECIES: ABC transporter ATP-binding protein [unclassified Halorhodospira]|uniref:ABC transporter ATP-binding protein n=1 Tax=unclassified Halorhodospira TaxID=2626748 RepID=UPI001EE7854A|nr:MULTISPECIES: ABC transporter ATP-binding protein [unclassified Halorhodospira]MCG5540158.1 ABC transporter ATP-binding protein/permease [Halorhodospira sp. M39old]MCG5545141.1 ABC transporter ATP-binding protein/permease [Halorhodospira sp. M38]
MHSIQRCLLSLTTRRERWLAAALFGAVVVNSLVQAVSVASVMPFLSVLGDPSVIDRNEWLGRAYDGLGFADPQVFLVFLGGVSFLLIMVGNALQATTVWGTTHFSHSLQYALSQRLLGDFLCRPYAFFLGRNSTELSKSVLEETRQVVEGAVLPALRVASQLVLVVAMVLLLLVIDPWLAMIVAAAFAGIYSGIYMGVRAWLRRIGDARLEANRLRFLAVGEAFAGAKEIRLLAREPVYLERYRDAARDYARHQANASVAADLPLYAIEAIAFGGVILLVLYLLGGEGLAYALPVIGVYALAAKRLVPAFQTIFHGVSRIRFTMPAVERLLAELGERPDTVPLLRSGDELHPLVPGSAVRLVGVTYRYPGANRPAVEDLNLEVPANATVGLVGPSGAGKSTVIDLLLGLLEPQTGQLTVDGVPVTPGNHRCWQAAVGYVPQHIFLADDTVAGNIALGVAPEAIDPEAVERASRLANLHEFVMTELADGYATRVGERGMRLSGGQRQRIGIARALYRDPPVLVFDEATSALDNATERAVMEAVHNLAHRKTIILVAHRLSTVKSCECIFVLERGRVVEAGTWEALSREGERFRRLAGVG